MRFPSVGGVRTNLAARAERAIGLMENTHSKDIPETPVVVLLCRELFLAGVI